ncbi:hypothetical protein B296_00027935 [Ensete ventricosum]|uniref:Uncharacterized protein n=1 Tax=Ensete ventricosum TaxID=4639 RepID=A0A426YAA0_ENSVE|nr:hypothetical protein B296_00027935 [Ensete ventricosum]
MQHMPALQYVISISPTAINQTEILLVFPGGICNGRRAGGVGVQAYVPCNMHPSMASAKELVPYLQSLRLVINPALKKDDVVFILCIGH